MAVGSAVSADDRVIRVEGLFNALKGRSNQQQLYSQGEEGLITLGKRWCCEGYWVRESARANK
jgi:hypothetical protein